MSIEHGQAPGDPKTATGGDTSAAATAPAKPPEMPARANEGPNANKRRSDRVLVALPVELTATDPNGVRFTEACFTEMVSLHGASVALPKRASAEHPVTLHRRALDLHDAGAA